MDEKLFQQLTKELEELDESKHIKHIKRSQWTDDMVKDKVLLWQIPKTTAEFLYFIASSKQPQLLLEWGTSGGYSTLWLAKACPQAQIHTIESCSYRANIARETLKKAEVKNVFLHEEKISAVISSWSYGFIDYLFIDADKQNYLKHFKLIEPYLHVGAVIIVDNMLDNPELVNNFKEYIQQHTHYFSTIFDFDNGLFFIIKK
jgi:predicted O-methyltransferase YrrM